MPKKVVNRFPDVQAGDLVRVKRGDTKGTVGVVTGLHHSSKLADSLNPYATLSDGKKYTLTNFEVLNKGSKA